MWSLGGDAYRASYAAIGESDRTTLKFLAPELSGNADAHAAYQMPLRH